MCGLAGCFDPLGDNSTAALTALAAAMGATIRHRGPDDEGVWADAASGVALASRRLAIIDLTPGGHQPMTSPSGRYVIAYNGEIYNFRDLRTRLEAMGATLRGHSDTEVLLAAIDQFGLHDALQELNGMFAFALWDRDERRLHLARDRIGEKPLYYGRAGRAMVFGSELRALRVHTAFSPEVDRRALTQYLRYGYVPEPMSIYYHARKVPPGAYVTLTADSALQMPEPVRYWSASDAVARGLEDPFRGTVDDAADALDELLRDSVRLRLESDVPLGAFLSGGVDSSLVAALAQSTIDRPLRTFTIGSPDPAYDERASAAAIARHLGTDHTELCVTTDEAAAVVPVLPTLYDEPFADSSQIPTFLVAQMARHQVTVALSGDGGDELFAGYNRYVLGRNLWRAVGWAPPAARVASGHVMRRVAPARWEQLYRKTARVLPRRMRVPAPGEKIQKFVDLLGSQDLDALCLGLISLWPRPEALVIGDYDAAAPAVATLERSIDRMMLTDLTGYLPGDVLAKVDRASMGVSLEARVPLLDHRVVEFAWRLPADYKIRRGTGKWLLRRVLDRYVPASLFERPKAGFSVPLDAWLRGGLRDWAAALLDQDRLLADGFLHPEPVLDAWHDHLAGRRNDAARLWAVLSFQAWLDEERRSSNPAPTRAA